VVREFSEPSILEGSEMADKENGGGNHHQLAQVHLENTAIKAI